MVFKKSSSRKPRRTIKVATNCEFCKGGKEPDYKNYTALKRYLSDRAKIIGKKRTGICSKHQRRLSLAIKRARHLGLLPLTPSI
jgi:small subunit ribosomal protein S18